MTSILFFIFAIFLGILLVYLLKIDLFIEEKLAWGTVLGSLLLTLLVFISALFFGFTKSVIFISFLLAFLVIGLISLKYRQNISKKIISDIGLFRKRLKSKKLILFLVVFFAALLFFGFLWPKVFYQKDQDIFTIAIDGVWGDWSAHSTYVSHFAYSDSISLEHPLFVGKKFSYTFMADFQSALLMKLGENMILAMVIPGFIFSLALVVLLYYFIFRITKRASVAALSIFLYLFGGGLGFIYFFKEINGMAFPEIMNFLKSSDLAYTHLFQHNIRFSNFIQALLLPQRALTIGMPLAILVLTYLLIALRKKNNYKLLLFAGATTALLPTIHLHSLMAVSITAFFLIILLSEDNVKNIIKRLLSFFGPLFALGFWQVLLLFPLEGGNFKFYLGWMARDENLLVFWIKNLGLFIILLPFAFLVLKRRLKIIYLAFCPLFILTNLFIFQPHDYDNIKITTYWFLLTAVVISVLLVKLWKRDVLAKVLVVMLFPFLILSFCLDLDRFCPKPRYRLFAKEDIRIAEIIREKTSSDSVFLTSNQHNHFVPCLTGRQIVAGYGGWLWTYGIDAGPRYKDVSLMFQGKEKAEELLKKYKVDYVIIGPSEKSHFNANESFYDKNYPLFLQMNNTKIYKIILN